MANLGVIILIIIIVLVCLTVVALILWAALAQKSANQTKTNNGKPACSQTVPAASLIQIPTNSSQVQCTQNGQTTQFYYIAQLGSGQYDYVVAPWGTQPLDVCVQFCTQYKAGSCTGPTYNGRSAQDNFNNCMSQLSRTDCNSPVPIAAVNGTLYYAYAPTCQTCDQCTS